MHFNQCILLIVACCSDIRITTFLMNALIENTKHDSVGIKIDLIEHQKRYSLLVQEDLKTNDQIAEHLYDQLRFFLYHMQHQFFLNSH